MNRRRYLTVLAATAGLAGCTDSDSVAQPEDEPTDRSPDAPTADDPETQTDAEPATETDTPEPATADVELRDVSLVREETRYSTDTYARVEVANTTARDHGYVEVSVRYYDEGGDLLDSTFTNTLLVPAGDTWVEYLRYFGTGSVARVEAEIADTTATTRVSIPDDVVLVESSLTMDSFGPTVTGRARNEGPTLDYLEVLATVYDEAGAFRGVGFDNITEFPGGDTWRFEVTVPMIAPDSASAIAEYAVTLDTSAL